ncbi:MAG: hypothetical protein PUF50_01770 [Erysipelotrichaceae bacterium]|nr:hypothetical protein [Erysipelotrichaceae bacterium]
MKNDIMKKTILLLLVFILFGCQSAVKNEVYDTTTKIVTCRQDGIENGYYEERFWVVNGHLVKRQIETSIPLENYIEDGVYGKTLEEIMNFLNSKIVISCMPPYPSHYPVYYDGENIVETIFLEIYDDMSLYDEKDISYRFERHLTKDKKWIVFDSFFKELQEAWESGDMHYTCKINKLYDDTTGE